MQRYVVSKFDGQTFLVVDQIEKREICICQNYDDFEDAENRAKKIVKALNSSNQKSQI